MKEQIQQTKVGAVKRRLTTQLISTQGKLQKVQEEKVLLEQQQRAEVKKLQVCVVMPGTNTVGFCVIIIIAGVRIVLSYSFVSHLRICMLRFLKITLDPDHLSPPNRNIP